MPNKNCYNGRGGRNVEQHHPADANGFPSRPKTMSVQQAKKLCADQGFAGFTYEPAKRLAWMLHEITDESKFTSNKAYDVYVASIATRVTAVRD